jgi:hypothetical protein
MARNYLKRTLLIFLLGFIGIVSLLLMPLPPLPAHIPEHLAPYLVLISPTILLIFASTIGTYLAQSINLHAPVLEKFIDKKSIATILAKQAYYGIIYGIALGIFLKLLSVITMPYLPENYVTLTKSLDISPITKLLYGGITEEILIRWGFMTTIVWFLSKMFNKKSKMLYIAAIIISAVAFALGHLPAAYAFVPDLTPLLLTYIIAGNVTFGLIAGCLFWIYGIEAAIFAHMICHVVLLCF